MVLVVIKYFSKRLIQNEKKNIVRTKTRNNILQGISQNSKDQNQKRNFTRIILKIINLQGLIYIIDKNICIFLI